MATERAGHWIFRTPDGQRELCWLPSRKARQEDFAIDLLTDEEAADPRGRVIWEECDEPCRLCKEREARYRYDRLRAPMRRPATEPKP